MGIQTKEYYSDFDNLFSVNEFTADIAKKKNSESIKQSIRNLLNRRFYSKLWNPQCGSYVKSLLFQQNDSSLLSIIRLHMMNVFELYEPRVQLVDVQIENDLDSAVVNMKITYREKETDIEQVFIYSITRLR